MRILYLHGFCASLNGKKAACLRSHLREHAVVEPPEPGFPYCKSVIKPVLQTLGDRFKSEPRVLLGLLGPNRTTELNRLWPELASLFVRSLRMAQELYDRLQPDIIVGSSMGGGVAMAMDSGETPMVLVGPVWNRKVRPALASDNALGMERFTKLLLGVASVALRDAVGRFAGFAVPPVIKPRTILLHSAHDEVFALEHSRSLMRSNPVAHDDPSHARIAQVIDRITAAGYANERSNRGRNYNDGRLIIIGKDHHANEPDPYDRRNRDPHPHNAMVTAVRLLLEDRDPN